MELSIDQIIHCIDVAQESCETLKNIADAKWDEMESVGEENETLLREWRFTEKLLEAQKDNLVEFYRKFYEATYKKVPKNVQIANTDEDVEEDE